MDETVNIKQYRASNAKAALMLFVPLSLLSSGIFLSFNESVWVYLSGQVLLGLFFFQAFILLHETGHFSFFSSKSLNRYFGHFFAFLSFIPFTSWVEIHNLHHRWTGWRDKDPTTSDTVSPNFGPVLRFIVNFCWLFWIPLFTIGYRFGNYWKLSKIKRYLPAQSVRIIKRNLLFQLLMYVLLFVFFGPWIVTYILPAYLISLVISDLFILSQHSHIAIPIAGSKEVKPIRYSEQVQYTRSVALSRFIAPWLYFNFNLHELHHAYPGLPAYYLHQVNVVTPNKVSFLRYLWQAKLLKGMTFIFSTSDRKIGS